MKASQDSSYNTKSILGELTVSDPRKVADPRLSITPHVLYSIRDSNYGPMVERRYSDFVWLVDRLEDHYAGVIIPPLPPKNSLDRFDDDFIESRRKALERFLNAVNKHKKLSKSIHLELFVRAPEATFNVHKKETTPSIARTAVNWIGNVFEKHTAQIKPLESAKTEVDIIFDGITQYVDQLYKHAVDVNAQIDIFVTSNIDQTRHMRAYTDALGKFEAVEEDVVLNSYLSDSAAGMRSLSDCYETYATAQLLELQYPFEEYVGLLESVMRALKRRNSLRRRFDWAKEQVEVKNARLLKITRADPEQEEMRRAELAEALDEDKAVTASLATVSDDLLVEYQRFKETRVVELKNIFMNFANLQQHFAKNAESYSKQLASRIALSTPSGMSMYKREAPTLARAASSGGGKYSGSAIMHEDEDEASYSSLPSASKMSR